MNKSAAILAVALLAGCAGGTSAAKPSPTPTPTVASPTPSPTPAVMTLPQARATYLRIVKPDNASIDALNKVLRAKPFSLSKAKRVAAVCEKAEHTFASQLYALPWPTRVVPTANKLADALAGEVVALRGMAQARTRAAFDANLDDFDSQTGGAKYAELLRTQIGLPPA
jgi:hypothetical protein